ncbi:MAG: amino acid transporter [Fimbriimonas sp.]
MAIAADKNNPLWRKWLLEGHVEEIEGPHEHEGKHKRQPWYKVMCLTGVDYFSTLGYQPGIAALVAGSISPLATLILVLLTLVGALPIYSKVAKESPNGDGSVAMLENLLSYWSGKLFVLVLLGFVATDFVITITLSAADAAAHFIENPLVPAMFHGQAVLVTLVFVSLLSAVFLKGFKEAIGIAVVLVVLYLGLNTIVIARGLYGLLSTPHEITDWWETLQESRGNNVFLLIGAALLAFPQLALGLSGFETGVAVMPLVKGGAGENPKRPVRRIANTRKMLSTAALIMSVFLLASSVITIAHIPSEEFRAATATHAAGKANGRALAYLAHEFFGSAFGSLYDLSTILILWFAGASAMAGLLNIVPRYLPRYGMAPEWTRAARPLVLIFTGICFLVTVVFKADVNAQGGAYATGVLVLMTSAAFAVTIAYRKEGNKLASWGTAAITLAFLYTTGANVVERPDGVRIASLFILSIVVVSFISRIWRTLELRVDRVDVDIKALELIAEASSGEIIRLIPNRPEEMDEAEYERQDLEAREDHQIEDSESLLFVEIFVTDPSAFSSVLRVEGHRVGKYRVLRAHGTAIPNSLAALMLWVRDRTGKRPHAYFNWTEGNPFSYVVRFVLFGKGEVAPITREILRRAESDIELRPAVHSA